MTAGRTGTRTAVVCAALDDAGDAAVRRLVDRLGASGRRVRTPPRHRPHLTLGAARVPDGEVEGVIEVAAAVAAAAAPFPLVLDHLGVFPGGGVLWLGPRPEPELRNLQVAVDEALGAAGHPRAFGDQTRPDRWIAHCTLATRLPPPELGQALATTAARFRPVRTAVTALATILVGGEGDVGLARLGEPAALA